MDDNNNIKSNNTSTLEIDIVGLKKDIVMLEREIQAYKEDMTRWQNNQDKRLDELAGCIDVLQQRLEKMIYQLNSLETKQTVNIKLNEEHKKQTDDFRRQLTENRQNNKNIWVPLLFTSALTIIGMIIQFFI